MSATPEVRKALNDDDIAALHTALLDEDIRSIQGYDVRECRIALGHLPNMTARRIQQAREHCAEVIAALRGAAGTTGASP